MEGRIIEVLLYRIAGNNYSWGKKFFIVLQCMRSGKPCTLRFSWGNFCGGQIAQEISK